MFAIIFSAFQLGSAVPHMSGIKEGQVAGKFAQDTMNAKVIIDPHQKGKDLDVQKMRGKIEFRDVVFRYPSREDNIVLGNKKPFSGVFEAGKMTALVGPSGSGKSTIIQLLERFYKPESGQILLDGVSIDEYDLRQLRRAIGYISQEAVLFNTTIRENLRLAVEKAGEDEMIEALKAASAWEFVKGLPNGLDTEVGSGGGQLSGGQK